LAGLHGVRDIFIAFEGGGAKGLAHVGALRGLRTIANELESQGVELNVSGVAGTSAGAIVAALFAAGYSADELIDPVRGKSLLQCPALAHLNLQSAAELLGKTHWKRIRNLRRCFGTLGWHAALVILCFSTAVGVMATEIPAAAVGVASLAVLAIFMASLYRASLGVASLDEAHKAIEAVLDAKFGRRDGEDRVRFRDFGGSTGRPSLKIVATDITHHKMILFSPETTPAAAVADAVAASICLPLVFRPWHIEDRKADFLDGALVSNLPAWPFDEERLLNPAALTLAFEIVDAPRPGTRPGLPRLLGASLLAPLRRAWRWMFGRNPHWLIPAGRTAVFGAQLLNKRAAGDLEVLSLNIGLGLLEFDAPARKVYEQVAQVTNYAEKRLRSVLVTVPTLMRATVESARQLVFDLITALVAPAMAEGDAPLRMRVAFAIQEDGAYRSFKLRYAAGFEADDGDRSLIVPAEGSFVGTAHAQGCGMYFPGGRHANSYGKAANRTELVRMREFSWQDMAWSYCLPFPRDLLPHQWRGLVVAVDSNRSLGELPTERVDQIMRTIEITLKNLVIPSLKQLQDEAERP